MTHLELSYLLSAMSIMTISLCDGDHTLKEIDAVAAAFVA